MPRRQWCFVDIEKDYCHWLLLWPQQRVCSEFFSTLFIYVVFSYSENRFYAANMIFRPFLLLLVCRCGSPSLSENRKCSTDPKQFTYQYPVRWSRRLTALSLLRWYCPTSGRTSVAFCWNRASWFFSSRLLRPSTPGSHHPRMPLPDR